MHVKHWLQEHKQVPLDVIPDSPVRSSWYKLLTHTPVQYSAPSSVTLYFLYEEKMLPKSLADCTATPIQSYEPLLLQQTAKNPSGGKKTLIAGVIAVQRVGHFQIMF